MLQKRLKNKNGFVLVATVMLTALLSYLGTSLVTLTSAGKMMGVQDLQATKTLQVGNAGIQYALDKVNNGQSPDTTKNFADGQFIITSDPALNQITVKSTMDDAEKIQVVSKNFSGTCVDWENSAVYDRNKKILDISLVKNCNNKAILTHLKGEWEWDDANKIKKIQFENPTNNVIYNEAPADAAPSGQKIDVADQDMIANGVYNFHSFQFTDFPPVSGTITVTAYFADGSEKTGIFNFVDDSPSEENNGNDENANNNNPDPGFEVQNNGDIAVQSGKNVEVRVIGTAITCGAYGPSINVKTDLGINGQYTALFNDQPIHGGEVYSTSTGGANIGYTIRSRASLKQCNNFSSTYTSNNIVQAKTLTNGQQVPNLSGFGGQQSVAQFLQNYVNDSGQVVLQANQAILLFELGVNLQRYPNSAAADFQDAVVLLTISDAGS